jgi:hypothetical protein
MSATTGSALNTEGSDLAQVIDDCKFVEPRR